MKRIIAVMAILILLISMLSGCGKKEKVEDTTGITLYFANKEKNDLVQEERGIVLKDGENIAERVMNELLKGPSVAGHKAVIPKKTELLSISKKNGTATVNLSSGYYKFEDSENSDATELLARYSIVQTLCTLDNVNSVKILIDGNELINAQGNSVGKISINDIISGETVEDNVAEKYVTLYFSDEQCEFMLPERRKVTIIDNSIEKTIVTALINGTKSSGLVNLIPKETKVLSVETKEKICFVNLSHEFADNFSGGSSVEAMTIYTIVNSLTELDDVDKVQFLIEGSKVDLYNDMVLSDPFEPNAEMISK